VNGRLVEIVRRLPRGFYKRLMEVVKETGATPEDIIDQGLRNQEVIAGIVVDAELERQILSRYHSRLAHQTSKDMGEHGRMLRARRGGYAKHARRANMSLVNEFLLRPVRS
jgi:hypothetical protein